MKNQFLRNAVLTALVACFMPFFNLNAQTIDVVETPPSNLTACLGQYQFSATIKNNAPTTISNVNIMLDLFDHVNYVAGSISGATEVSATPSNQPVFNIATMASGQIITISYMVHVECDVIPILTDNINDAIVNTYAFTFTGASGSPQMAIAENAYNILYSDLSVGVDWYLTGTIATPPSSINIGTVFSYPNLHRQAEIVNGGNGATDTVIIRITPESEIQFNGFLAGNSLTPVVPLLVGGDYVFTLTGADFVNCGINTGNPNLFEPGESIRIFEDFTVISCSATNDDTQYETASLCNASNCEVSAGNALTSSGISVNQGFANIKSGIMDGVSPEHMANYCGKDTVFRFYWTNTATGANDMATNLQLDIVSYQDQTGANAASVPYSFELFDFEINTVSLNGDPILQTVNNLTFPHSYSNLVTTTTDNNYNMPGFFLDFTNNTNPIYGLQDLDGDTFYDDLATGDTVFIYCKFRFLEDTTFANECPLRYNSVYGMPQVKWDDNCGNQTHGSSGYNNQNTYSMGISITSEGDIIEPIDFVEDSTEVFTFCTNHYNPYVEFWDCPIDSNYAVIHVPEGYALNFGVVTGFQDSALYMPYDLSSGLNDSIHLSAEQIGQDIYIYGGGFGRFWGGCYQIPILLDCDLAPNGIAGTTPISWELLYLCDTCSVEVKRSCFTQNVRNHAECISGSPCAGIVSKNLDVKRTSFGWTDLNMTTHVNPTINLGLNLDAAYAYDTVKANVSGVVTSTSMTQAFASINYDYVTSPFFSVLGGTFNIYNGGSLISSCGGINLTQTTTGGVHTITYEMPSPCLLGLTIGDSVVLSIDLFTNNSTFINGSGNNDNYEIQDFRSYYSTIIDDTLNQCDNWGDRFNLYSTKTHTKVESIVDGCNNTKIQLFTRHWGGTPGNDFPNEYRPIDYVHSPLVFTLPTGYEYVAGSATAFFYAEGLGYPLDHTQSVIPTQSGDVLTFTFNVPTIDKASKEGFNTTPPIFEFELKPSCDRSDTLLASLEYNYDTYFYAQDPSYFVNYDWNESNGYLPIYYINSDTFNINRNNFNPNLKLQVLNNVEQQGYTNSVYWDVQLCNQTDNAHPQIGVADNVWFDIDNLLGNVGDIIIDNVVQINPFSTPTTTYYNSDHSAFTELNTLNVNQCKTYRIYVSYNNCRENEVDTLRLLNGWTCDDYPTPQGAEDSVCHANEQFLFLRYKTANLQLQALQTPTGTQSICDTLHYEFQLTSSSPANMYDVDFWLNLPDGVDTINVEYAYPDSLTWHPLNGATTNYPPTNQIGWNLTEVIPQLLVDDTSFVGNRMPTKNNIWIRFDLIMDCEEFNPAMPLLVSTDGITNCNDSIVQTNPYEIIIEGFENLVNYDLNHNQVDTLDCDDSNTVTFVLHNESLTANSIGDSLRIDIPLGFEFVSGSGTPTQPTVAGNELVWAVGNIPSGDSIVYTFEINPLITLADCQTISFPAEVYRTDSSNCSVDCDVTASWKDTLTTLYCCNPCNADANFLADTICEGEEYCFTISDTAMFNDNYNHLWILDEDVYSNADEPCFTFATAGTYPITHIVYDFENNCADTVTQNIIVTPMPEGAIELLGCNPFCEGDTVFLTVSGEYESIDWVNLADPNTVIGTGDTLAISTGGVYNAVLHLGACVDSCLAITVNSQPTPNINLNDTIVCDSSGLVTLDAGAGYNHYLWSTGDTTQTITVGVGTYTVEVGQQLTYGCCLCLATDTVVVGLNSFDVALQDTTICTGDSITLSPTITGGVAPYTYAWSTGDTTSTIVVGTSGVYSVLITDAIGCQDSASMTLNLGTTADADFTFSDSLCLSETACFEALNDGVDEWNIYLGVTPVTSFGDIDTMCYQFPSAGTYSIEHILTSLCGTDTVTHVINVVSPSIDLNDTLVCSALDSVVLDAGAGYDVYAWSTGDSTQTISVGNGTYTVTVGNYVDGVLCTATDSVTVGISNMDVSLSDTTICFGDSVLISPTITGGVPTFTYSWTTGDTISGIYVSTAGTYGVTVTDALGCQDSASMNLNVIMPPNSGFVFDDTICIHDTACFVGIENGVDTWNIYDENGTFIVSYMDSSEFCFQFPNIGTYTIEHVVTSPCTSDTTIGVIEVIPPLQACIEMIGSNPFCEGDTVLLTVHDPFNQVQSIDWYKDSVYVGTFDTLVVTDGGIYTAMVEDQNGCVDACMCIVLTQIPTNNDLLVRDTVYVCGGGDTETLSANGVYSSYTWYRNNAVVGNTQSITVSTPGMYILEVQNANGCTGRDTAYVILRQISGVISQSPTTLCVGQAATITVTCDPNYTYVWQRDPPGFVSWTNIPGTGCVNSIIVPNLGANHYRVIITDQLTGCSRTINFLIVAIPGPCNGIVVSPNPTVNRHSTIYYTLDDRGIQDAKVEIIGMMGDVVKTHKIDVEQQEFDLDFSGYAEGVYMIRLICDGEIMANERIVVTE